MMTWIWSPRNSLDNRRPDLARCRESVSIRDGGWGQSQQCTRKAVVFRCVEDREGEFGFCRQHDPDAVKARDQARQDRWESQWAERKAAAERARQQVAAQDAARVALEQIAAGHNDPRTLAAEVLAMFPA